MYVFMHERCQLYDLKIKWSSEREKIPLKIQLLLLFWSLSKRNNRCENNEPYLSVQLAKKKKIRHVHAKALHCFIETFWKFGEEN